jgi:hypothetical protein
LEQTLGRISVLWQYQAHRDSGLSLAVVAPGTARFPIDGFRVTTTNKAVEVTLKAGSSALHVAQNGLSDLGKALSKVKPPPLPSPLRFLFDF